MPHYAIQHDQLDTTPCYTCPSTHEGEALSCSLGFLHASSADAFFTWTSRYILQWPCGMALSVVYNTWFVASTRWSTIHTVMYIATRMCHGSYGTSPGACTNYHSYGRVRMICIVLMACVVCIACNVRMYHAAYASHVFSVYWMQCLWCVCTIW